MFIDEFRQHMIKAVREARPCEEHSKQKCLYGCDHVRPEDCDDCAMNIARAVVEAWQSVKV